MYKCSGSEALKEWKSKYHNEKVKSLKRQSTLVCIFSYVEENIQI